MTEQIKIGPLIRERRLSLGLKQAALARDVGISASYLNLIEHDRRRIGGKLLVAIAKALGLDPQVLTRARLDPMTADLQALAKSHHMPVETAQIDDFATRFPGWAAALTAQAARIADLEQMLGGLDERLTHDPQLSADMTDMLAAISAIRSTASILIASPEIDAGWRRRFDGNIDTESRRLAESSARMAARFEHLARAPLDQATPLEAARALLDSASYHFAQIESRGAEAVSTVLAGADQPLTRRMLEVYARDADHMPLAPFDAAARELDYDPAALGTHFAAPLPSVFRRLASLPGAADRPDIGLVACDTAGAVVFAKAPRGFDLPRGDAPCPLWPLFDALSQNGQPIRCAVQSADDTRFDTFAICEPRGPAQFGTPVTHVAWMLLIARNTDGTARRVGATCRLCAVRDCAARREPSILT